LIKDENTIIKQIIDMLLNREESIYEVLIKVKCLLKCLLILYE